MALAHGVLFLLVLLIKTTNRHMVPLSSNWPFFFLTCLLRHTNEKESKTSDLLSLMNSRRGWWGEDEEISELTFPCCAVQGRKEENKIDIELTARNISRRLESHSMLINGLNNHHRY